MALRDHVGQQLSCCSCSSGVADSASPAPVHQTASVIKSPPSLVVVLGLVRIQASSVFGSHFLRLNQERKKRERLKAVSYKLEVKRIEVRGGRERGREI